MLVCLTVRQKYLYFYMVEDLHLMILSMYSLPQIRQNLLYITPSSFIVAYFLKTVATHMGLLCVNCRTVSLMSKSRAMMSLQKSYVSKMCSESG